MTFVTQYVFPDLVRLGERVQLRLVWDAPNSRFLAALDDGPDVPIPYPPALHVGPARVPVADLRIHAVTANCSAGAVVSDTLIEVGDVATNASAVVP